MSPVSQIFMGQGKTKSYYLKIYKSQYLVEYLRYGSNFLHFAYDHNSYRSQNNFLQHKVSRRSFINFQGLAISDLGFKRVMV